MPAFTDTSGALSTPRYCVSSPTSHVKAKNGWVVHAAVALNVIVSIVIIRGGRPPSRGSHASSHRRHLHAWPIVRSVSTACRHSLAALLSWDLSCMRRPRAAPLRAKISQLQSSLCGSRRARERRVLPGSATSQAPRPARQVTSSGTLCLCK